MKAGHQKGAAGGLRRAARPEKNYFSLAPQRRARSRDCGAHSRRWEPEPNTQRNLPPLPVGTVGTVAAQKKRVLTNGRNEATREREPVARQPSTGLQLGADAVPRYAGRISRTVGFAVKTQCGGPGKVPCGNSKAKRSRFKTLLLLLLILLCALAKSWESGTRLRTGASVRS